MSTLSLDQITIPAVALGPGHPFVTSEDCSHDIDDNVPREDRRYINYGQVRTHLPYTVQGDYGRKRVPTVFRVAVLENQLLRATFMLDYGGRLYSLVYKPENRELLYVNPVIQPVNFAIRNAWFNGGVEWNFGWPGHSVHTCAPMFAARAALDDGTPVLRMYEWERVRQMVYQIDAYLLDDSPLLYVRVRLVNPHDTDTPVYWWSNIAMPQPPQMPGTRVIAPANSALNFGYWGKLSMVPFPATQDGDMSYPNNNLRANDYFFRLSNEQRPWVAAVDSDGHGLFQASTSRLRGRKMFIYGQGPGGISWQRFETEGDHPYMEIQAGLATTQAECLPMPAHSEWQWLEVYGAINVDAATVHGDDWSHACSAVEQQVDQIVPMALLEQALASTEAMAKRRPVEMLHCGSGWGALEQKRSGQPIADDAVIFDDASIDDECAPWLALLEEGALPDADSALVPTSLMIQPQWRQLLEAAVAGGRSDHWLAHFHLGLMYDADDRSKDAAAAWRRSIERTPNAWAYRYLAAAADAQEAVDLYLCAVELAPTFVPLVVECGNALLAADRAQDWLDLLETLRDQLPPLGRINMLEGRAALAVNDLDRVRRILDGDLVIADLREGDIASSDLWFRYHEQRIAGEQGIAVDDALRQRVQRDYPPPAHLDFRMTQPA